MPDHPTTVTGYENPNDQRNIGPLGLPGTDHNQWLYRMRCGHCGTEYAANGSDVQGRKCPECQGGAPSTGGWEPDRLDQADASKINSSNPGRGRDFELAVQAWLGTQGISTRQHFSVNVGAASDRRPHKFDLGCNDPPRLVECKRHTWTSGGNAPSAKLTVWNEAMHYFACAPVQYQKMLVVLRSLRNGESLAEHYIRRYGHLVPKGVEIWEFDEEEKQAQKLFTGS